MSDLVPQAAIDAALDEAFGKEFYYQKLGGEQR